MKRADIITLQPACRQAGEWSPPKAGMPDVTELGGGV